MLATSLIFRDPAFIDRAVETELIANLIRPHFLSQSDEDLERLMIFAFDDRDRLAGFVEGDAEHRCSALLTPAMVRESLSIAVCSTLIMVHNHPSGDASPSSADHDLTRRFCAAATLAGIVVHDHLILTDAGHFSFRAAGLL